MKVILGLTMMSLLAWGQETPPKTVTVRKLIQLKYASASRISSLLRSYTNLSVDADDNMHMIAVRGTDDMVAAFEEAVKKLDVAPLDFELTVYLISATPQPGD